MKLDGRLTKPALAIRQNKYAFRLTLTEGRNRQIRRMVEALGHEVRALKRLRIINVKLGKLRPGEVRPLSSKEVRELQRALS